ncbi:MULTISPECIES: hypothetical protein [unclassified Brevundimonas]|uniref:hypothetical protein n=1 Tax=unclassified Brevundimonas TaxID=2622653 RepID=UPI0025C53C40|nr:MULTISPECIES: hypothetical protein [unclassified Brevundimonas]
MLSPGELSRARTDALANAGTVYGLVLRINALAANGDQSEVINRLGELAEILPLELQTIDLILAAERETAKAMDATQTTLSRFFPRPAAEHAHAANDEGHAPSPENPTPTVA